MLGSSLAILKKSTNWRLWDVTFSWYMAWLCSSECHGVTVETWPRTSRCLKRAESSRESLLGDMEFYLCWFQNGSDRPGKFDVVELASYISVVLNYS
jgi:hypothetical protein